MIKNAELTTSIKFLLGVDKTECGTNKFNQN